MRGGGEFHGTFSCIVQKSVAAPRVSLLGVPIDALTQAQAMEQLTIWLQHPQSKKHVMTPNNEMLVMAARDPLFKALLQRSALNLPDSTGLILMARLRGEKIPERVTGTDMLQRLCELLGPEHPVFLLGAGDGVAECAAEELKGRNPRLIIAGTYSGSPRDSDAPDIIRRINASGAHLLFVAYGAPMQDVWIDRYLKEMPTVRIAMGVGGAFDFIAGVQKRAPQWMRSMGLEWLWRLMREPKRLPRIFNAVVVFPLLCIREQLIAYRL